MSDEKDPTARSGENPDAPGAPDSPAPGTSPAGSSAAGPASPAGQAGKPIPGTAYSGDSPIGYSPPPKRSSAQIRADIEAQRAELGESVDQLRGRVTELTDWRSQLRKHRKEVTIAAVATGFVIGGLMALRRRR